MLDCARLNPRSVIRRLQAWLKPATASLCTALLLGIVFAAAVAPLHKSLHDGCRHEQQPEQSCAVCAFVKGQVDAVDFPSPVVAREFTSVTLSVSESTLLLPAVDFLLLPERAPPFAS